MPIWSSYVVVERHIDIGGNAECMDLSRVVYFVFWGSISKLTNSWHGETSENGFGAGLGAAWRRFSLWRDQPAAGISSGGSQDASGRVVVRNCKTNSHSTRRARLRRDATCWAQATLGVFQVGSRLGRYFPPLRASRSQKEQPSHSSICIALRYSFHFTRTTFLELDCEALHTFQLGSCGP